MRKLYYLIIGVVLSGSVYAQDVVTTTTTTTTSTTPELKSKKGEDYLPAGDEWGLGVSANPFLDYLGNFINGYDGFNSSPSFDFASNPANNIAIFGKMMVDANTAYRVRFNVSVNNRINKAIIGQNQLNPDPAFPAFAQDWQKVNTTAIVIAPGIEKRRGSTRLQGIYGGELVLGFNNVKTTYDYGNPMSVDFPAPSTTNFGNNIVNGTTGAAATRITEQKSGSNILVGARGFIGVEYFFAPKISIGGEFGYMLGYQTNNKGLITTETWDGATLSPRKTEVDTFNNGFSSLGIGIDNLSGSINLLFYF